MSVTIWKFVVNPWHGPMKMPKAARLIHAHEQNGQICVWAEVDPGAPTVGRHVVVVGTGHPLPSAAKAYVGTAHIEEAGTPLVLHVYDGGEVEA